MIDSTPIGSSTEDGVVGYNFKFKVGEVLRGDAALNGKTIRVNIERIEMDEKDQHPLLKKDGECILFLKHTPRNLPPWQAADLWFAVQYPSPGMAQSLKRLAAEK